MPIISMFYGIIIRLYLLDNKQHNVPHIHAGKRTSRLPSASKTARYWPANCLASNRAWFKRGSNCVATS